MVAYCSMDAYIMCRVTHSPSNMLNTTVVEALQCFIHIQSEPWFCVGLKKLVGPAPTSLDMGPKVKAAKHFNAAPAAPPVAVPAGVGPGIVSEIELLPGEKGSSNLAYMKTLAVAWALMQDDDVFQGIHMCSVGSGTR